MHRGSRLWALQLRGPMCGQACCCTWWTWRSACCSRRSRCTSRAVTCRWTARSSPYTSALGPLRPSTPSRSAPLLPGRGRARALNAEQNALRAATFPHQLLRTVPLQVEACQYSAHCSCAQQGHLGVCGTVDAGHFLAAVKVVQDIGKGIWRRAGPVCGHGESESQHFI